MAFLDDVRVRHQQLPRDHLRVEILLEANRELKESRGHRYVIYLFILTISCDNVCYKR